MKYEDRLGWCEEGQTYCSIAETEYKRIRNDAIDEVINIIINEKWDYTLINKIESLKEKTND